MPSATSPLRRLLGIAWLAFAAIVVAVAVAVSLARLLLPLADGYRAEIERLASQQLGRPVEIGGLSAGWYGLHPHLRLQDVRVLGEPGGRPWLSLDEVRASIEVIPSLLQGRLQTGSIEVVGGAVEVVRRAGGSYGVAGLEGDQEAAASGLSRLLGFLAAHDRLRAVDSTLRVRDPRISSAPLTFSGLNLKVDAAAGQWRVSGLGALAGQGERRLAFVVEVAGDPRSADALRTRLFLDGQLRLGAWLDGTAVEPLAGARGDVQVRLWAEAGRTLNAVVGDFQAQQLQWRPAGAEASLEQVGARVFWQRRADGWRLMVERLQVAREGREWPESGVQMRWRRLPDGGAAVEAAVPFLRLEDVHGFLPTLAGLSPALEPLLVQLRPRGELWAAEGRFTTAPNAAPSYFVRTRFRNLTVEPVGAFPGVSGADGALVADAQRGYLALDSRDLAVQDLRFRAPLWVARASAQAYWSAAQSGWQLHVPTFALHSADAEARGTLDLTLPAAGSPVLALEASVGHGRVAAARDYLPVGIMPPQVVEWLDRALVAGEARDGKVVFRGPIEAFPFEQGGGTFLAEFVVDDLILDYGPQWPRLEEAAAGVRFANRSLAATVHGARILELEVERGSVAIERLGKDAVVAIDGRVRGPAQDALDYLRKGPLREDPPAILAQLQAQGPSRMDLRLALPVRDLDRSRLDGTLTLQGVDVHWPARKQRFEAVDGEVRVSYQDRQPAFQADGIPLRWRDAPARLDVRTEGAGSQRRWMLSLHTAQGLRSLLQGELGHSAPDYLQGSTQWTLGVTVSAPAKDRAVAVVLGADSDLRGIGVALPPPLGKSPAEPRALRLRAQLGDGEAVPVQLQYGDLNAALRLRAGELERGEIRWGADARLPDHSGMALAGHLQRLEISAWRTWLNARSGPGPGAAAPADWLQHLRRVDLAVDTLELFGQDLHDVSLQAQREGNYWSGKTHAREVGGTVQVPVDAARGDPLRLDLSYLHLNLPEEDDGGGNAASLDPEQLPPLEVSSDLFTFNQISFGRFELAATPTAGGLAVRRLTLTSPYLRMSATGHWINGPAGQLSRFDAQASTDDLGDALKRSGFAGTVEGGQARVWLDATWPGSPLRFDLARTDGNLKLDIRRGQLLEVEPGGGRIVGLLSLQALPRRLALDFSDLFRRGFAFDEIQGTFSVSNGDAYTNDLFMEGPSARVEISGRTGLDARDYDQLAVVTPRMSASIPVVGGLAGGPAVGLGLWVAERVFGKRIDELSRVRYSITGTWEAPVVRRIDPNADNGGE